MLDERDLQAIAQLMVQQRQGIMEDVEKLMDQKLEYIKEDLSQVKEDLSQVKEDLAQLKEEHEITRDALDYLCGWAEKVGDSISFPLPKP